MDQLSCRHAYVLVVFFCFFCCSARSALLFFSEPETCANGIIATKLSIKGVGQTEWGDSLKFCQKDKHQIVVLSDGLDEREHRVTGEYDSVKKQLIMKHAIRGRLDYRYGFTVFFADTKRTLNPERKYITFAGPNVEQHVHLKKADNSVNDKEWHSITEAIFFIDIELSEMSSGRFLPLLVIELISPPVLKDKTISARSHGNESIEVDAVTKIRSETYQDFCRLGRMDSKENIDRIVVDIPSQVAFLRKKINIMNSVYIKVSEFDGFADTVWNNVVFKVYAKGKSLFVRVLLTKSTDRFVYMAAASRPVSNEFLYSVFFESKDGSAKMKVTSGQWKFNFKGKEDERNKDAHMYFELSGQTVENVRGMREPQMLCEGPAVCFSFDAAKRMKNCSANVEDETIKYEPNELNINRVDQQLLAAAYFIQHRMLWSAIIGCAVQKLFKVSGGFAALNIGAFAGIGSALVAKRINYFLRKGKRLDTCKVSTVVAIGVFLGLAPGISL